MATVKRFEDIECWQEARKFVKMIYGLTKKADFKKDYEFEEAPDRVGYYGHEIIREFTHEDARL